MEKDFLIIGQGIAGSCLALELLKQNKSFLLVDKPKAGSASRVAAGVINPVVFKRLTPTWRAQEIIPFAKKFYLELEKRFKQKLFYPIHIHRVISNENEIHLWQTKQNDPELFPFVNGIINNDNTQITAAKGLGKIYESAYVDLNLFLDLVRSKLQENKVFLEADFNYDELKIEQNDVKWKAYSFKKVVFCEGWRATENPYFSWLPFKNTKGEVLELSFQRLKTKAIINKQVSVIPQPDGTFKCGATYAWEWNTLAPEKSAKDNLLEKLQVFISEKPQVLRQKAGIRPTMKDRRPCLGNHPKEKQLYIFNGAGSKGASLYPLFTQQFVQHLIENKPLEKSVDISRFYKYF